MNPWLMGLLAAAFSALAGASSLWDTRPEESELGTVEASAEGELPDDEQQRDVRRPWLNRSAPPDIDFVHPLAALDDEQIGLLVQNDLAALGSASVGSPSRGALVNGVQFPESPLWHKVDPEHAWGTRESVEFVKHAITRVNERFPNTPVLFVGDFSAQKGGRLRPHKSHQSGRDVDLGYYYLTDPVWYRPAHAGNLDRARTWALLETLITETQVEYVFIDRRIQPLLMEYALAYGEDPEWVSRVFRGSPGKRDSIVRHRWGHATHMHVRFENPTAELTARRSYAWLKQAGILPGRGYYPKPRPRRARARAR